MLCGFCSLFPPKGQFKREGRIPEQLIENESNIMVFLAAAGAGPSQDCPISLDTDNPADSKTDKTLGMLSITNASLLRKN